MESQQRAITLSIRETTQGADSAFAFHVLVNEQVVASNRDLSNLESQTVKSISRQFSELLEQQYDPQTSATRLAALGVQLFDIWLRPTWQRISDQIPSGSHRLLLIASDSPDILNLPWEILRLPDGDFVGFDSKFRLRRSPMHGSTLAQSVLQLRPRPLRILFHACAPLDQEPLAYEQEERVLLREVAKAGPNVAFDSGDLGTFEELRERVNEYQPHIIHLHGHGYLDDDDQGFFLFEDERGESDARSSGDIRQLLAGSNVQCVFVSGCQTGRAPGVAAVGGICQGLVNEEIPLAIGWGSSIADGTAMMFAQIFYNTLAAGQPVDRALLQARQRIRALCEERGDPSWALPVLYAATKQELVFDPDVQRPMVLPPRPTVVQQPLPGMTEGFAELFVGRRREIQRLLPRLQDGRLQIVLITGLADSGKSTLATRLARKLEADGFGIIPVPSTTSNPLSAARLLQICGEAFLGTNLRDAYAILRDASVPVIDRLHHIVATLNLNRFVLVLDNFEVNMDDETRHILDPAIADFYTHLLTDMAGGSRAIITCRYQPNVQHRLPVGVEELTLGELSEAAFFKFLLHSEIVEARYYRGELPHDTLAQIYHLLGGTPGFLLQIREMLNTISANDLQHSLRGLSLMTDMAPSVLRRLRDEYCERIVVSRLYGRLPLDLGRALSQAAVYRIPINLAGLVAVTDLSIEYLRDAARQWQDYALVYPYAEQSTGEFWVVYGLLRNWLLAPERLDPAQKREAHRSAGGFLFELASEGRQGELDLTWIEALLEARAHFLQAEDLQQAWLATHRLSEFLSLQGLYDDVIALNSELRGLLTESDREYSRPTPELWIANSYLQRGDYPAARDSYSRILTDAGDTSTSQSAAAWAGLAGVDIHQGNYAHAGERLREALHILQHIGDRSGEAAIWHQLAVIDERQGDYGEAREKFYKSLAIEQALGNLLGEAGTWHGLATIDRHVGEYEAAREKLHEALEIEQKFGNRVGEMSTRLELAALDAEQGRYEPARNEYREVLQVAQQMGHVAHEADAWYGIASIDERQGYYDPAREKLRRVLDIRQQSGDRANEAAVWDKLSMLDVHQGRYDTATEAVERALEMSQAIGDAMRERSAWHQLATIELRQGRYESARTNLEKALGIARTMGDIAGEASALHQLGSVDLMFGEVESARSRFAQTLELVKSLGRKASEASAQLQLASLEISLKEFESARNRLENVLEVRKQTGDIAGEANVLHQLAVIDIEEERFADGRQKLKRTLAVSREIGLQDGEAAARYMLATIDLREGAHLEALKDFRYSLRIRQEMQDSLGESTTWYQLGVLAVALGHHTEGTRLAGLAYLMQRALDHGGARFAYENFRFLTTQLELNADEIEALLTEVGEAYGRDRGASLLTAAFRLETESKSVPAYPPSDT